jgi:hypothetical protein
LFIHRTNFHHRTKVSRNETYSLFSRYYRKFVMEYSGAANEKDHWNYRYTGSSDSDVCSRQFLARSADGARQHAQREPGADFHGGRRARAAKVYVDEPGYMQGSVRQGLVKRIQDTRGIQDLRVVSELPQPGEGPVLFVEVTPLQFLWLPVFTRANLEVHMVYSSDGDMSWMDHQAVVMESSPLERLRGDFNVADTSFGLMTLRGQARYLGRQTADELLKAIDANLY